MHFAQVNRFGVGVGIEKVLFDPDTDPDPEVVGLRRITINLSEGDNQKLLFRVVEQVELVETVGLDLERPGHETGAADQESSGRLATGSQAFGAQAIILFLLLPLGQKVPPGLTGCLSPLYQSAYCTATSA
jgi:hypothetical protein